MEKICASGKGISHSGLLSAATPGRRPKATRRSKAGLKAFFASCLLLLCGLSLFAAEAEMIMPRQPLALGEPFTISFVFYGASPDAVFWEGEESEGGAGLEGAFPPSFSVEAARKSLSSLSRQGVFAGSGSRATVIEIEAIPKEAGEFVIGPFAFMAGRERVTFESARVFVAAAQFQAGQGAPLRLFWLAQEGQGGGFVFPSEALGLEAGKGVLLILMAPKQADGSVRCPAPENSLLEPISLDSPEMQSLLLALEGGEYKAAAAYIWTPFFSGRQALPQAAFSPADGGAPSFSESAEANIAAPRVLQSAQPAQGSGEAFAASLPESPAALEIEKPYELSALDGDSRLEANLAQAASIFWDEGQRAKAAVILRAAESAFPLSRRISQMRAAADNALGVEGKSSSLLERSLFLAPLALIPAAVILFALVIISFARGKKGGRRASLFANKSLIIACALLAALGAGAALYGYFSGGIEEAAATGGFLFRVPDAESAAVSALKEGEPLKVLRRREAWLYVKTAGGALGWYPSSEIIVYKSGDLL